MRGEVTLKRNIDLRLGVTALVVVLWLLFTACALGAQVSIK